MSEIRVNRVVSADGSSAPQFPSGLSLATGMGITNSPNITGSAVTFSGISKVTNSTDSTSSTTGSLIVTGGVGIAKNVYIGAGLSVAGTLTYEDATNIDSVGLVTAQSGIRVPGGEVTVGVAFSVGNAGVATAAGFVGPLTGAVQTAAQTNITSLGTLTGLTVSGDLSFDNGEDAGKDLTWDVSADSLIFNDSVYAKFGTGSDLEVYHDGTHNYIKSSNGNIRIWSSGSSEAISIVADAGVSLSYGNSVKLDTTNDGVKITGITTFTQGANFDGILSEKFNTTAGKLSDNLNIDLENGMIHLFTTTETTTSTPNIRYNSSKSLNNMLTTGDSVSVTVITTTAAAAYSANWTVDGSAVTEEWNGGAAPSEGGASGYDVYTITLLKTGNAAFTVLGNLSNFA